MLTLDTQLFYVFNSLAGQSPFLDRIIVFFATYLAYLLVLLFLAFAFFRHSSKREKWELLLVAGASAIIARFGITELIRLFYHHPRPFAELPGVHALFTDNAWSFPSGHATFFFALATAVYLYNRKWGIAFFVSAVLVTTGRIAAGVHYPSDILGGALVGIIVACAVYAVARKVMLKGNTRG